MGKTGKRKHISISRTPNTQNSVNSVDTDDDSGFGSNVSHEPNHKMVRTDENNELILFKTIIKQTSEPIINTISTNISTRPILQNFTNNTNYPSKSKNGKYELKILSQPEEQHRARYLTEGSRGAIKDRTGLSHPQIKLCGYLKDVVTIQCFIGHDKYLGLPHLFYQASKITGKNSTQCTQTKMEGTTLILMEAFPDKDMKVNVDCVGILKERNVDVEQKLVNLKNKSDSTNNSTVPTKKRSTRCRLVFRCQIPNTNEILQVVSCPILCTQPLGTPEISKKSLSQCDIKGGQELFIIGKNFLKDAKVIWKQDDNSWNKVVEPDKEFLHSTHLVCVIPSYDGPDSDKGSVEVSIMIKSGGKLSDAHSFTYINNQNVNAMTLISGTTQLNIGSAASQVLLSNFDNPIVLTMIGTTANESNINSSKCSEMTASLINDDFQSEIREISQSKANELASITNNTIGYANSTQQCIIPIDNKTDSFEPNFLNQIQTISPPIETFSQVSDISFENESNNNRIDINNSNTNNEMIESHELPKSQYLNVDTYTTPNQTVVLNQTFSTDSVDNIPSIAYNTDPISKLLEPLTTSVEGTNSITCVNSEPNISLASTDALTNPLSLMVSEQNTNMISTSNLTNSMTGLNSDSSVRVTTLPQTSSNDVICTNHPISINESLAVVNPVLSSTLTTPITQASNISVLSELSDAELLSFINPAAFDQSNTNHAFF